MYPAASPGKRKIPCVGAAIVAPDGSMLLVRRRNPPAAGRWSLPGGRVEAAESDAQALTREVAEETGLQVRVGPLVGTVERDAPGGGVYAIRDYACEVTGGSLLAGDDALEARWFRIADLTADDVSPGLLDTLREWGYAGR